MDDTNKSAIVHLMIFNILRTMFNDQLCNCETLAETYVKRLITNGAEVIDEVASLVEESFASIVTTEGFRC
jgi:hypothetical protein